MTRYILINPPCEVPDVKEYQNKLVFKQNISTWNISEDSQPLGLLKIANLLSRQQHDVGLIDCRAESTAYRKNSILNKTPVGFKKFGNSDKSKIRVNLHGMNYSDIKESLIREKKPDQIFLTSTYTYDNKPLEKIINICKEIFPDVPVTLGGIFPTLCPESAKELNADEIHCGPYDKAFDAWSELAFLDYDPRYAAIKTSLGCPNNCSYCATNKLEGSHMHFRDPLDVIEEIKDKISKHAVNRFTFWESNILARFKNHFKKILDLMIEERLNIELALPEGFQPNLITPEIATKFRQAGLSYVQVALDSTSKDMKSITGRPVGRKETAKAIHVLKNAGFDKDNIYCVIMAGMPGQTMQEIIDSIRFVWKQNCRLGINAYAPIPGTDMFERNPYFHSTPYENLNPYLWPCAHPGMTAHDLMCIFGADDCTPLEYVRLMKNNKEFLRRIFNETELKYLLKKAG